MGVARVLGTAFLACLLASCSSAPPETYDLSAVRGFTAPRTGGQVAVTEPSATAALDSNRIVIRTGPESVAYLTGAQWSNRLPALVQARLVQSFENARLGGSVGRPGERLAPDYSLVTDIRAFEIDEGRGQAVVELSVKLVNERSGRIVANGIFRSAQPGGLNGAGASAALDAALGDVMRQIVRWTGAKI